MEEQKHTSGVYTVSENSGSYQNIFLDGKIWIGSVERGLAIEICNKLNQRLELLQQVAALTKENERLKEQNKSLFNACETREKEIDELRNIVIDVTHMTIPDQETEPYKWNLIRRAQSLLSKFEV